MKLHENFLDDLDRDDVLLLDDSDLTPGNWDRVEDCDIKILCHGDMSVYLPYDKYKRFLDKLKKFLKFERYLTKCSEPFITSVSQYYGTDLGGHVPTDVLHLVESEDEYITLTGIWIEFCCSTRFFKASQVYRFLKTILNLSYYHDGIPKWQIDNFYIYNRMIARDSQFTDLKYQLPRREVIRSANELKLTTTFEDHISPAMMLCNRRPQAYEKIVEETAFNVFPWENRVFNEKMLKQSHYNVWSVGTKLLNAVKRGIRVDSDLFQDDVKLYIVNVAYSKFNYDCGSGRGVKEFCNRVPWEKEVLEQILTVDKPLAAKFNVFPLKKEVQLFVWLGTFILEDVYITGLNTYNVFVEIHGSNYTLAQQDDFVSTVCRVFPHVNENDLKDAFNKLK